ncbi:CinA family protein [Nocardioides cavernaquae]|uniref:Nicotinamide-nucleotide amidohydrolase family protein n=1 Tax=Nocardioides cavernaquae TaxID=2321396 RepID=A0A3A5HI01_9ACTN|nr:nicotinamide-nucleotide amidohydrolase family protein [Nocardioides cavernaquae]RJS47510.1 nicotinamide-nucleotide amidohydrolase family protein [Nocardioides cavernaquae]
MAEAEETEIVESPTVAAQLVAGLLGRGETVATAESLTGGLLSGAITAAAGASSVYVGGVVTYATRAKEELLAVPAELVVEEGVVSAACAESMARGVRRLLGTVYGVSTTGVAGPDTQDGKAVGTVYIGLATAAGSWSVELHLDGDRSRIREATVEAALAELLRALG